MERLRQETMTMDRDCPTSKLCYPTKAVCLQEISKILKADPTLTRRPYKCPFCRFWHVTSQAIREQACSKDEPQQR